MNQVKTLKSKECILIAVWNTTGSKKFIIKIFTTKRKSTDFNRNIPYQVRSRSKYTDRDSIQTLRDFRSHTVKSSPSGNRALVFEYKPELNFSIFKNLEGETFRIEISISSNIPTMVAAEIPMNSPKLPPTSEMNREKGYS